MVKSYPFLPFKENSTATAPIIVIVGSKPETLRVAESALAASGFRCQSFTEPSKALEYFRRNRDNCPLVISDIRIPGMNGFRLARLLRRIRAETKIVFMTEFEVNRAEFERLFPSLKIDAFIRKPFDPKKLLEIVEQHMTMDFD